MELSAENSPALRNRKGSSRKTEQKPKLEISIPGLNRLFDQSLGKTTKIVWLSTMIFYAIVCTTLTVYQLQEYFKFPSSTKTIIERKQTVQFPPISICSIKSDECYKRELKQEIKHKCQQKRITNCNVDKIPIQQLGINLTTVWDRCHFISVKTIVVASADIRNESNAMNYKDTKSHTNLGTCVTITHTKKMKYAAIDLLQVVILTKNELQLPALIFYPHQESDFTESAMEFVRVGYCTQFKLREEVFQLQNITGRECYDQLYEKSRAKQNDAVLIKSNICRLPSLTSDFPDCNSLEEFEASLYKFQDMVQHLWNEKFKARRICRQVFYSISTDFVLPGELNKANGTEDIQVVTTEITVKFADNTRVIVVEYFSYTFPALMSDLFAYWGFFLCLSALVFAEIVEFLFHKIYQFCKQSRNMSK